MLTELRVRDFAIIDRLTLELGEGLNVLTGETGAGKSIIVGALSLLLGERASSDAVRTGAARAEVEGVFDVQRLPAVQSILTDHGVEPEDGLLILRREISSSGRGRVWVNGAAATVAFLGELGTHLVDLHGQHEHQSLLHPREQRVLLDAWSGAADLAADVAERHARVRSARTRLAELEAQVRVTEQRADFLRFQVDEIERARPRSGEEEELEVEARRLAHASELAGLANGLHTELYAGENAVASRLTDIRRILEQVIRIDPALEPWREVVENALYGLEELGREMGGYGNRIADDPARLDEIRRRQDLLQRLRRKYGPDLEDVLRTAEAARSELSRLDSAQMDHAELEREIVREEQDLRTAATRLTAARTDGAGRLADEIAAALPGLGMPGARFAIELTPLPEAGPAGAEDVELRIAVNAGFDPRPLARVASGGELSRVMLALKTCLARLDRIPTLIFDEIDAGIGGRVARQVGDKLQQVARSHQVFVITHLPQIASRADHHLLVRKTDSAGIAATDVERLDGDARVRELARLLGGDPESDVSRQHARELLASR
ncbi:MAG TPA: DNA repair protein RecN [Longimicrobiales bacterium]|nr:DNA repair protein RecN [Longimicrobiales bacterium]